ncbi:pyridoxamine 5'-phosphate oxidase family protein [Nostoc parmelioides]|uniref:Pyridoxamine 5'-phosphate oxidase family protein n=1 Tax=Nostoc parmelioides FACHB-3921 TaxID=2692909 RepID=A0ABR8BNZ0_9NOSO|nr:pyridoxamine 5'-phosphate oxidase family protein [Nostoc parmelioides]MBD2255556.1 pyridoxamine 5'-phosphate oxidase family protein [Nostoc parmelioides FACHB-3921]
MTISTNRNQQVQNLKEIIADMGYAMLTTVDDDGSLHSRPMYFNGDIDAEGTLWFFTSASSHKALEIEQRQQVNVNFSSPNQQRFISISATAELVKERQKIQARWKSELETWFPQGLNEPDIALLKVNIKRVDYWDDPSNFRAKSMSGLGENV